MSSLLNAHPVFSPSNSHHHRLRPSPVNQGILVFVCCLYLSTINQIRCRRHPISPSCFSPTYLLTPSLLDM
ncbi:hypothetical protein L1887_34777 [Cichorium endivia]|nr:hypothetical protein L1887_34777 [Cichorium endivia]